MTLFVASLHSVVCLVELSYVALSNIAVAWLSVLGEIPDYHSDNSGITVVLSDVDNIVFILIL